MISIGSSRSVSWRAYDTGLQRDMAAFRQRMCFGKRSFVTGFRRRAKLRRRYRGVDAGAIYQGLLQRHGAYLCGRRNFTGSGEAGRGYGRSFFEGLKYCVAGNYLSDVSHAIQVHLESNGFGVIRDYVGHGLGRKCTDSPGSNYGRPGRGPKLKKGMVLAIGPMVSAGSYAVKVLPDEWTAVTGDSSLAARYGYSSYYRCGTAGYNAFYKGENYGYYKNDLVPRQIVKSKAGHDKGCVFFVVEVLDDEYVLIADGGRRKYDSPKKRN